METVEYSKSEEKTIRERAKELNIGNWRNKKIEKLVEEMALMEATTEEKSVEAPADPGLKGRQDMAHVIARLEAIEEENIKLRDTLSDTLEDNARLSELVKSVPLKEVPPRPNRNVMRYKQKPDGKPGEYITQQFGPEAAKKAESEGWVDSPAKIEGYEAP